MFIFVKNFKMKKYLHITISIILAIFFIYKGYNKINSEVSNLETQDIENIQNIKDNPKNYITAKTGEKPTGYKITMNTMKQSGFLNMIALFQIIAGILMIIPKTRLLGLLLLLPIIFNIFMMHLFFDNRMDENIVTGILLLTNILLLTYYHKILFNKLTIKK
jgi:uncharacterized membrane protein YphA (DoxX/SURF4 family)